MRYRICIEKVSYANYTLEARSEEEAEETAKLLLEEEEIEYDISVTEVTE